MIKKLLFAIAFVGTVASAGAQQLTNNGFETWASGKATGWGGYVDLNAAAATYFQETTTKQSGTYSVRIESTNIAIAGQVLPGLAFSGAIVNQQFKPAKFTGTSQPQTMDSYFQYNPANGDTGLVMALFFKWNTSLNKRDTIGGIGYYLLGATGAFQGYSDSIQWDNSSTPDSVIVLFASSGGAATQEGSQMFVDDVMFSYTVGTRQPIGGSDKVVLYPNPATTTLNLAVNTELVGSTLVVFDALGRNVKSVAVESYNMQFNINELNNGMYFYQIVTSNGSVKHTGKFNVAK